MGGQQGRVGQDSMSECGQASYVWLPHGDGLFLGSGGMPPILGSE